MKGPIYLDFAAATPLDPAVFKAMEPYLTDQFHNPSGLTGASRQVKQRVEAARASVAKQLSARTHEIIFTAGGTESTNLAIRGVMQAYPQAEIVISNIEHSAVQEPARFFPHRVAHAGENGRLLTSDIAPVISNKTVLVSVMYANNEIGTIQPIRDIAKLVAEIRKQREKRGNKLPLYLHSDACQATNYLDIHVDSLGVDLLTLNGGKIYGPKQSGILYVKTGVTLQPQILGGGQEFGLRSGTENVAGIVGFEAALKLSQQRKKSEVKRLRELQSLLIEMLGKELPNSRLNGDIKHRLPNNIHVTLDGIDNERVLMELDEAGIQCGIGSACSASSEKPSTVLAAIGLSDQEARSSLRFSLGISTNAIDIRTTVKELSRLVKKHH